jgi:hypothetical protein
MAYRWRSLDVARDDNGERPAIKATNGRAPAVADARSLPRFALPRFAVTRFAVTRFAVTRFAVTRFAVPRFALPRGR